MAIAKPYHEFESIEALSLEMITSRALLESVRMKLFDRLEASQTAEQISSALGTLEPATEALLELLTAKQLLEKTGSEYRNNPAASEFLVTSSPFYQGESLEFHADYSQRVVAEMGSLFRGNEGDRMWTSPRRATPEALRGIAQYAVRGSLQDAVDFITALPGFADWQSMCDIGGNHGRYSMALVDENPGLTSEIVDLPGLIPAIETLCEEAGYRDRISAVACDLRTETLLKEAYDLVFASHVLHVFADDLKPVIEKIAAALKPGGQLVFQGLNPEAGGNSDRKAIRELVTRLMGHATHFIRQEKLEAVFA